MFVCFFFFFDNFLLLKFIYIGKLKEFYSKFPYTFHLDSIPKVFCLLMINFKTHKKYFCMDYRFYRSRDDHSFPEDVIKKEQYDVYDSY